MMCRKGNTSCQLLKRLVKEQAGSAGVEFTLIAPVFALLLAAVFEIGLVMRAQFALISSVSAAANHTLSLGDTIDGASAQNVAAIIAALAAGTDRSATVNLNNAVMAHFDHGNIAFLDSSGDISSCYCALRLDGAFSWGSAASCGAPCSDGSVAGRFVEISATVPFRPMLGLYGEFIDQTLQNSAVVRLQ